MRLGNSLGVGIAETSDVLELSQLLFDVLKQRFKESCPLRAGRRILGLKDWPQRRPDDRLYKHFHSNFVREKPTIFGKKRKELVLITIQVIK